MIRLIHSWWDFSRCWGGVGSPLFWWNAVLLAAFIVAAVLFLRQRTSAVKPWVFVLAIVVAMTVHVFILLLTWSQVWGSLYITSYHWAIGEREKNAFSMWQATVGLGAMSSCSLVATLLLIKPDKSAIGIGTPLE
jgi:hypothetical protein